MELFAQMTTLKLAGCAFSASTWMSRCSVVSFALMLKASEAHSLAAPLTALRAGKSFDRMLTLPDPSNAHSACARGLASNATTDK